MPPSWKTVGLQKISATARAFAAAICEMEPFDPTARLGVHGKSDVYHAMGAAQRWMMHDSTLDVEADAEEDLEDEGGEEDGPALPRKKTKACFTPALKPTPDRQNERAAGKVEQNLIAKKKKLTSMVEQLGRDVAAHTSDEDALAAALLEKDTVMANINKDDEDADGKIAGEITKVWDKVTKAKTKLATWPDYMTKSITSILEYVDQVKKIMVEWENIKDADGNDYNITKEERRIRKYNFTKS